MNNSQQYAINRSIMENNLNLPKLNLPKNKTPIQTTPNPLIFNPEQLISSLKINKNNVKYHYPKN